ncbi:ATP-dependent RNA helicase DeaD [Cognatiyoonia sediminum]|uniref:ATP-dependent RNA helicase DeaD n=1 Tax=Cognatiyoonia sediminum TaxID=1508389 RepID=A0A1M5RN58_9RHOB|nr:DEAD/DEAH box helicase [Cognatiyoonia sediminum]SHH27702.1 ATP-dependent RNA helicase DeaD [Cognatiyoonia sediminum]
MQDFSGLPHTLSTALSKKGYSGLTPVQQAVTDEGLRGSDLLVSAQTGSGKTVGFGLAMAGDLLDEDGRFGRPAAPQAAVIAPTRELALQVRREFDWLFGEAGIVTASAVGGMDARTERRAIERGAHVIVATPGRLRDHIARGVIDMSDLKTVVLDEADEMLDMGFSEDLEFILDHTPESRRTLMFSATVPHGIAKLAQTYQNEDAERLKVGSAEKQHSDISYSALTVAPSDIEKAIINLLRFHDAQTAIVFANTRSMVARLTAKFANRGFSVVSLSGELSQAERTNAMQALRDGRAQVCVATDVAARGIDLPGLELVIHADLPSNVEALLHRSGRTGRAGRKGNSILIVPARQRSKAQRLLKFAKLEADWGTPPSAEEVLAKDEERIASNPALDEPPSAEELAFAARLLDGRTPEQIAAAYLRLYRERHSAPEILGAVPEPGQRKPRDHAEFGPSTWFSMSLGRKDRAEPRWLLPMLCRNAGLSKSAIGAIRVQYQETFVEIASDAVATMKQELGPDLNLEQGAALTELTGKPDFEGSPKGPPADARPPRDGKRGPKPQSFDKPKSAKRPQKPKDDAPVASKPKADVSKMTKKPSDKPASKAKPKHSKPPASKPKSEGRSAAPSTKSTDKKRQKKPFNASDPSKSLGPRKARHKGKGKGAGAPTAKSGRGKGGDARPFRKPSKRS